MTVGGERDHELRRVHRGDDDGVHGPCVGAMPAAGLSRRAAAQPLRAGPRRAGARRSLINPASLRARRRPGSTACSAASSTCRRKRSASSICSWPAGRRRWRRSTTSRCSTQRNGEQLPDSVRQGQRLTGMSGNQSSLPLAGSQFGFAQHGAAGAWVSELLPHTAKVVDDLCIVRSMYTEAINHDPAITFFQTGSQIAGRPSMGAWVHYGLGSDNEDLPAFVVLDHAGQGRPAAVRRGCGAAASCRRSTRACSSAAAAIRCCISPTPTASSRESRRLHARST